MTIKGKMTCKEGLELAKQLRIEGVYMKCISTWMSPEEAIKFITEDPLYYNRIDPFILYKIK